VFQFVDVQTEVQNEVLRMIENSANGNLTYQDLQNLDYMEQVLYEVLRLHTPLGIFNRAATQDYTFPGTNVTLKRGDEVYINAIGIHHDRKYYPNPEKFNPDNFSKENKEKRHPCTFLGFGQGPRICIGMRFALIEIKLVLSVVLQHFNLLKCESTPETLTAKPDSLIGTPQEALIVKLQKRM